ncbi:MAG: ATP-binding cassette domain-containing protein [Lachnospiraceae bacterium]|nr:ATP-binding cassette domain-containing protein [Lachnospiraceae bacterium]
MNYSVEIKGLRKEFGSKVAVDNLDLRIKEGNLFAFLGVNGAGKTTTIKMLTGLSEPTAGEAYVMGHSIATNLSEVKKIVNISPQETSVAPNLTVRENLEFIAGIYGFDKNGVKGKVDEMIEQFSLGEVESSKAKTLSGGWQRKLSIAMALITEPKVLFLDEPTLGLDVLARRELWREIEALKGKITIILTTHYMEEAEALSDEIAVMAKGKLKAVGTLAELKELTGTDNLEDAFVKIVEEM